MTDSTATRPLPRPNASACLAAWITLGAWLVQAPAAERIALNAHMLINLSGRQRATEFAGAQEPATDSNVRVCPLRPDGRPSCDGYAGRCPTGDQTQVRGFSLDPPRVSTATRIALQPDSTTGRQTPFPIAHGRVTFGVSERPVFVVAQ